MNPFANIMAAVMRGAAEVQGQEEAKREADKQAAGVAKSSLTHNPDGTVTIKNIDPTLLNPEDRGTNLQKAYETPKINVEKSLRERGIVPQDIDIVNNPEKVDQFTERYRARRKLGGGVIQSALMAGVTGSRTDTRLRENLQSQNARQNSVDFQKFVKPVMDEEQDEAQLGASAANTREIATKRRSDLIAKVATFQPGATENGALTSLNEQLGGFAAGEEEQARKAFRTDRSSFLTKRAQELASTQGQTAIEAYGEGDIGRFIAEQVGESPENLTDTERNRFVGIFAGLQQKKRRAAEDQALQRERDERAERREQRIAELSVEMKNTRDAERIFKREEALADDYRGETKAYRSISERVAQIEALATTATGATDVALLYQYMKALDSDSVVRESEYKIATGIGGVLTRMVQAGQRAYNGKLLTPENRQQIVAAAKQLSNTLNKNRDGLKDFYTRRAKSAGVDPKNVGFDIDEGAKVITDPKAARGLFK